MAVPHSKMKSHKRGDTLPIKPARSIQEIGEVIKKHGKPFELDTDDALDPQRDRLVWFIIDGRLSMVRKGDDKHLFTIIAPSLIGLTELFQTQGYHLLLAKTKCSGFCIEGTRLRALITTNPVWESVANILSFHIHSLMARDEQLMAASSYQAIRHKLMELMTYPQEMRSSISIRKFIQEGTNISRSHVVRILSELAQGKYIVVNKGKLVSIKFLPLDF